VRRADVAVVVAAGPGPRLLDGLPREALVVAADGGLERALALGLDVDVVVGDFDSIPARALEHAERAGAHVIRHPRAKDATDLELALQEALAAGARRLVVVASGGGRLDHLVALLLQLGAPELAGVELDAHVGDALVHVVRSERALRGRPGELLTLLALGGPAVGVTTRGLEYPLRGETLEPGSTRGVSNLFTAQEARVSLTGGVLLAIRPSPGSGP
jgi:thiamine pyrophosphokinase